MYCLTVKLRQPCNGIIQLFQSGIFTGCFQRKLLQNLFLSLFFS